MPTTKAKAATVTLYIAALAFVVGMGVLSCSTLQRDAARSIPSSTANSSKPRKKTHENYGSTYFASPPMRKHLNRGLRNSWTVRRDHSMIKIGRYTYKNSTANRPKHFEKDVGHKYISFANGRPIDDSQAALHAHFGS
ncbi:hypothetical protein F4604DRAFT_1674574 [Suillus subluteus]|nr:hypothetical protein F4604DRAFT_1674574 [Suillus subluteus]